MHITNEKVRRTMQAQRFAHSIVVYNVHITFNQNRVFCVWMIFVLFGFTNYMSDEHDTWKKKQSSMAFRIFLIFFCSVCSYPYRQISILNVNKHGLSMSVLLMFMLEIQCPPCRTPNTPMQTLQRLSPSIRGCARCPCTWTVTIHIRTYK